MSMTKAPFMDIASANGAFCDHFPAAQPLLGASVAIGQGAPAYLAGKASGTKYMSNEEAQDFLNMIFGKGAVKQFFWAYNPNDKIEDFFNILTGNTKGMTAGQIKRAKTAFVIAARLNLERQASNSTYQWETRVKLLADYCKSEADPVGIIQDELIGAALDGLGLPADIVDKCDAEDVAMALNVVTSLAGLNQQGNAKQVIAELNILHQDHSSDAHPAVSGMMEDLERASNSNGYGSAGRTNGKDKSQAREYAEIIYNIEMSIS